MERTLIKDALKNPGTRVVLCGWVHRIRDLGSLMFLLIRDRTGIIQAVVEQKHGAHLRLESVIEIAGTSILNPKAPGGVEIQCQDLKVVSEVEYDILPLQVNKKVLNSSLDVSLDHRVLSLRNPAIHSIFSIQQEITSCFRDFYKFRGFTEVHTPKIVSEGTEGGYVKIRAGARKIRFLPRYIQIRRTSPRRVCNRP